MNSTCSILVFVITFCISSLPYGSTECSCQASCSGNATPNIESNGGVCSNEQRDISSNSTVFVASSYIPSSCADMKSKNPNSPSGYYNIVDNLGQVITTYCQMETLCDIDGPWTRVAYLDMTYPKQPCPGSLREYGANGVRVCGRPVANSGSCSSVYFDVPADPYTKVCGRVTGYQFATTSAVDKNINSIDTHYVDGVSLTKGSPRKHVWTFMTGFSNSNPPSNLACPCGSPTSQTTQSFIGDNYFCEAGSPVSNPTYILHTSDPLWDGLACGTNEANCCNAPGIPWFNRSFSTPSNDFLEMRVCCDEGTGNEDSPIGYYEIYVQ